MKITRRGALLSPLVAMAVPFAAWNAPERRDAGNPKLSENLPDLTPASLRWLKQLGCKHVIYQDDADLIDPSHKGYWTAAEIQGAKKACEEAGLILESMLIPIKYYPKARRGLPGRDEETDKICRTIRAAGEAGLPMMEWRFWPDFFWDERVGYYEAEGRGGAIYRAFDYDRVKNAPPFDGIGVVDEKEMWARFLYFARPVIAAAEKAGVRLSMHPNDPPVPVMRGVARIFHHPDNLRRFLQEVPSPASGITFCQGTITEMGVNVFAEIRSFGRLGKIFLVHFRAVRGKVPRYTEVFIDEGDVDRLAAMKTYQEVGDTGPMVSDHTPHIPGDTPWGHVGRTYSHGYLRALVQAVNAA